MQRSKGLYKETLSEFGHPPVQNLTGVGGFVMIPRNVFRSKAITPATKLVLAALGDAAWQSKTPGFAGASHNSLAAMAGLSRTQVLESLKVLTAIGLIEKNGDPVHQVQQYRFLHPRMKVKEAKDLSRLNKENLVPKPRCSNCEKRSNTINQTGWCFSCRTRVELLADLRRESVA